MRMKTDPTRATIQNQVPNDEVKKVIKAKIVQKGPISLVAMTER
jgi:hypothetical protein